MFVLNTANNGYDTINIFLANVERDLLKEAFRRRRFVLQPVGPRSRLIWDHRDHGDCPHRCSVANGRHIKSYARYNPVSKEFAWVAITSSNLSQAAWGALQSNDSQLFVRSYEAGILFVPAAAQRFVMPPDADTDTAASSSGRSSGAGSAEVVRTTHLVPLPFDLPLTP